MVLPGTHQTCGSSALRLAKDCLLLALGRKSEGLHLVVVVWPSKNEEGLFLASINIRQSMTDGRWQPERYRL
jgi:hypothetical protein